MTSQDEVHPDPQLQKMADQASERVLQAAWKDVLRLLQKYTKDYVKTGKEQYDHIFQ